MKPETRKRKAKERFAVAERMEKEYLRSLRQLVKQIDQMTKGMVNPKMSEDELKIAQSQLTTMLRSYSETIKPWAKALAEKIVLKIAKTDEKEWVQLGKQLNHSLNKELNDAPTGDLLKNFLAEQVKLITSLPLEAAERVHDMTLKGITTGERADSIAKRILETGDVTEARAKLIARTEVARTASGLTMARSKHIGSTHYYWRTSKDADVRDSHKKMDGKIIEWAAPPEVEPGKNYHAGMFPNCRCYAEPILYTD
jgi:SPP1 gp7 family putative phage head morphogenesis protein